MSPRSSNRDALLEGAIRSLQERGYAGTRARDIAAAAGANLASIGYHFGSTEALLGEALAEGLRRWLAEYARAIGTERQGPTKDRIDRAATALRASLERNRGLAIAFVEALTQAQRSEPLRATLAESYEQGRRAVVAMFDLPPDKAGAALASLLIAIFDGMLVQWLVDPDRTPDVIQISGALKQLGALE